MAGSSVSAQDKVALRSADAPKDAIWLDSLDLSKIGQNYESARAGKSVENNPLTLNGIVYPHGVGTHAESSAMIDLNGCASKFVSLVGVDDERAGSGSITFEIWVDGKKVADTGLMKGGERAKLLSVNLSGAKKMILMVTDGGDGITNDHADWAGAMLVLVPGAKDKPELVSFKDTTPVVISSVSSIRPAIHGPRIVGCTPGRPFLFKVPATGQGGLIYSARNLPAGLALNQETGIISGALKQAGRYTVDLTVRSKYGSAVRKLIILGGDHVLAQTPPMGWNSWNVWGGAVDDAKVRAAADWMIKSGLAAHGYQYINIDDTWEGERDSNGEITTNKKFPDMKALADYVHSKGLKLGIYSSPGPKTCGGYEGSYQHEEQDAKTYAKWGIDYLKHDWCSYASIAGPNPGLAGFQKPYRVMRDALDKCDRDIVYSLCQYGMGKVWEWGNEIGADCWRTTGDITDSWASMSGIAFGEDGHEKYAGPGHWNDPDMLVVGKVGWGPSLHQTRLTPQEQVFHVTMWILISAPMLIGCDLSQMDRFTMDLLTNDEVLDVNQDPLGKPAGRRSREGSAEVWARPLWDGTIAVGLFNRGMQKRQVTARWADLGIKGSQPVRDLWSRKDLGKYKGEFSLSIPAHGAVLVKIGKPNRTDW